MVALIISVACWNVNAVARTSVTRQEIGNEERLQAEKLLWELGYWAGPIDGTFDSASRHAYRAILWYPRGVISALQSAKSIAPDHVQAVYVDFDEEAPAKLRESGNDGERE